MTDNLKAFLEAASKDKELLEKLKTAGTPEAVIALAKEKGFDLTAEDLKQDRKSTRLNSSHTDSSRMPSSA